MKLRINAKLRAALIAAITAVGFTLTQAQAEAVQLSGVTPTALNSSTAGNSGLDWTDETGNLTSWRLTFTLTEKRASVADNVLLGTNGNGTSSAGGDMLKILSNGSFMLEAGGSSITTSAGEIQSGGTATVVLEYIADYNQYDVSLNKGTYNLTVNNGEVKSLVVSDDNNTNFLKGTGSNTRLWTNSKNEWYSDITLWQLDNKTITITASQWKGTSTDNVWKTDNFTPAFETNGDVVFNASGYTTVVVDSEVQAGALTVSGTSYTFDIQSDGILSAKSVNVAEGGTIKLEGAGTYALASGTKALGSVSLSNDWSGTVRLSGVSMANDNLKNTYTKNGSWVEMNGVTGGYLAGWNNNSEDANIKLTDPNGGVAWKWTDGASDHETLITFNGSWKGTGTFFKDTTNKWQGFKYTGNISGWTGDFRAKATNSNAVTKLEFAGSANDVKIANIKNEGVSALNVVLSTGGSMSVASNISKTSTGAVNLTIDNSTAATLSGTVTADSLTINAGSSLTNTGALTINGTITFGANAIQNNGSGTIAFGDAIHFDLTRMTAVENKYTLFSGTGAAIDLRGYDATYITVAGGTAGKTWSFNDNGTISFTVSSGKVWTDSAGTGKWNYADANWDGATFEEGDVAQFSEFYEVTVDDDVVAGGIQVEGAIFISNDEATPGSLTSPSVEVAGEAYLTTTLTVEGVEAYSVGAGGVWMISADQTLAAGTGFGDGTVKVMDGGSVTYTGTATEADWSRVSNDGTVSVDFGNATARVDMEDSTGILEVRGGTVDYRSKLGEQTLKLDNGTKLLFGDKDGAAVDAPVFTNDIVLGGNATIQVHGNSKHSSVTISGDVTGTGYTLTKADGNQNLTFSGKVDIAGLTTASNGNGTIIFNGGEGSLGAITTNGEVTIRFSASADPEADNAYTFTTFAMAPSTAKRWLIVDKDVTVEGTGTGLGDDKKSTIMNSWGLNGGGLEVNGTLTTAAAIGMDAGKTEAHIKGSGLINAGGLNICNYTTTYIEGGITINITSDTGIYKRNNPGNLQLKDATLQATTVDWAIKDGGNDHIIALADAITGTTFDVADERTITVNHVLSGEGKLVKVGEGTLVLAKNNTYTGDTVVKGGTLQVNGSLSADSTISVEGDAILAGTGVDIANVSIAATKTATFKDGITTEEGVVFAKDGGVEVKNTSAEGGSPIQYGIDQAAAQVTADTMTVGGTEEVVVSNSLVVDEIVNNNANGLVLNGNVEDGVTLRAIGGDIVLAGQTSNTVSVVDLEIAADKMVMMPNGDDEGTITVTDTLTGGDATLLANLTLVGGSTLDVNGGDTHALTLGSTLTFDFANSAGLVNLDDETIAALNNLAEGGHLDLIVSANSEFDPLTYGGDGYDGLGYDELFSRIGGQGVELQGNYTVYAKDDAFGLTKQGAVPEPTTGTLSLLALMALAARRRRK